MGKMTLLQSSCKADDSCVVYCKSQANLLLHHIHLDVEATLVRVNDGNGKYWFVWADIDHEFDELCFCPVFAGDEEDIPAIENVEPIVPDKDVFCHNGMVYFVHKNKCGDLVILNLPILSSEDIVRQILQYDEDDAEIRDVSLIHLYAVGKGREYLTTAWVVWFDDGTLDYWPMFHNDIRLFNVYSLGKLLKEPVKIGISFKAHGKYYCPLKDENGMLYLQQSKNPLLRPISMQ